MSYADFMRAKHSRKPSVAATPPSTFQPTGSQPFAPIPKPVAPTPVDMSNINSSFLGGPVPTVAPTAPANPLAGLTPDQMMQSISEGTADYDLIAVSDELARRTVPTVAPTAPTVMAPANPLAGLTPDQMMQGVAEGTSNYDLIAVSDELARRTGQNVTETPNAPVAQPAMTATPVQKQEPTIGTPQPIASPNQGYADFMKAKHSTKPSVADVDLTGATVPPATSIAPASPVMAPPTVMAPATPNQPVAQPTITATPDQGYADFMKAIHGPNASPATPAPVTPTLATPTLATPAPATPATPFLGSAPATSTVMDPPTVMASDNPLANLSSDQMMQGVAEGTADYDLIAVSDELQRRRNQTATPNQPVAQPATVANQVAPLDPIGGMPQPIASPNQGLGFLSANAPPMDPARPAGVSTGDMRPQYDAEGNLTGYGPSGGVGASGTEGASNYGLVPDPTAASTPANFMQRPGMDLIGATVPNLRGLGGSDYGPNTGLLPATPPTMVNVGGSMTAGQNFTVDPNTRYQPTTTMAVSGSTPYEEYGLTEAQRLYEQGAPEYYQGQTFTDFAPQTEQALRAQEERALAGSPVMQAAQDLTQKTLSGDFLGSNPYLEGAIQRALDPVQSRINSQLAQRGRAGSGLAALETAKALGNVAGDLSFRDYSAERDRQQSALSYAPSMASADYADIAQLGAVGVAREGQAQKSIDDAMARYEYAQEAPFTALGQYSNFLGGFPAGTTSQAYNPYNPPTESQQQLSNAAAVAGILPENASTTEKIIAALLGGLL